jgi:hypothetical protein
MKYILSAAFAAAVIFATVVSGVFVLPTVSVAQGVDEAAKLNTQAVKLYSQGLYADAEPLFKQSLAYSLFANTGSISNGRLKHSPPNSL